MADPGPDPPPEGRSQVARAADRRLVAIPAVLRDGQGMQWSGTITDISEQGCGVQIGHGEPPAAGAVLTIRFGILEAQAACTAWAGDGRAGFAFMDPLYGAIVDDLVSRHPPPGQCEPE